MRITNKIMQTNSLNNVNYNKIMADKMNTQMSTQKKITRPSDDPVIAIRALRLRSNVSEVTQYYSKNIPDAESWLSVTEGALDNVAKVITDMYKQCTKGASGEITSEDRKIVLESLKALRDEVYATGDADYAGRYVFAGYRTDTSLMFPSQTKLNYQITEQLDKSAMDSIIYVKTTNAKGDDLYNMNVSNYQNMDMSENDIDDMEVHRIRLAYSDIDAGVVPTLTYTDAAGAQQTITASTTMNSYDIPSPYEAIQNDPDGVIFVPDTGELLLGENVYNDLMDTKDSPSTATVNEGEIRITYEKTNWLKGDLRPEHYFACSTNPNDADKRVDYNQDYLNSVSGSTQVIEYDVGFNQTIRVNSTADECFKHGVGREVDDLIRSLENTIAAEKVVSELSGLLEQKKGTAEEADIQKKLDAANKAYNLLKNSTQTLFENGLTTMQGYLNDANLAVTNNGTRGQKLALIESRMMTQKTNFETLKSENEDIDLAEIMIQMTSAEMTYEASLLATGKVMQTTLLNFI